MPKIAILKSEKINLSKYLCFSILENKVFDYFRTRKKLHSLLIINKINTSYEITCLY